MALDSYMHVHRCTSLKEMRAAGTRGLFLAGTIYCQLLEVCLGSPVLLASHITTHLLTRLMKDS